MSAPSCLYCNDTGVLYRIETDKGEFTTYCDKCPAAGPENPSPTPTPPTEDIVRE